MSELIGNERRQLPSGAAGSDRPAVTNSHNQNKHSHLLRNPLVVMNPLRLSHNSCIKHFLTANTVISLHR